MDSENISNMEINKGSVNLSYIPDEESSEVKLSSYKPRRASDIYNFSSDIPDTSSGSTLRDEEIECQKGKESKVFEAIGGKDCDYDSSDEVDDDIIDHIYGMRYTGEHLIEAFHPKNFARSDKSTLSAEGSSDLPNWPTGCSSDDPVSFNASKNSNFTLKIDKRPQHKRLIPVFDRERSRNGSTSSSLNGKPTKFSDLESLASSRVTSDRIRPMDFNYETFSSISTISNPDDMSLFSASFPLKLWQSWINSVGLV